MESKKHLTVPELILSELEHTTLTNSEGTKDPPLTTPRKNRRPRHAWTSSLEPLNLNQTPHQKKSPSQTSPETLPSKNTKRKSLGFLSSPLHSLREKPSYSSASSQQSITPHPKQPKSYREGRVSPLADDFYERSLTDPGKLSIAHTARRAALPPRERKSINHSKTASSKIAQTPRRSLNSARKPPLARRSHEHHIVRPVVSPRPSPAPPSRSEETRFQVAPTPTLVPRRSFQHHLFKEVEKQQPLIQEELTKINNYSSFKYCVNDLDNLSGRTLLYIACKNGDIDLVDTLLKINGITVDGIQDRHNATTPLHVATWGGHVEIVAMLLASRARPQSTGVHPLPEKELHRISDKERKLMMEELWEAYNEKTSIELYLPPGKKLNDYKRQDMVTLETIVTALTSEPIHRTASALFFESINEGKVDLKRIELMDLLLTYRLYCKPEELLFLLEKRYYQKKDTTEEKVIQEKILRLSHSNPKSLSSFIQ
eukprot:TRINITY_DN13134_c0_g4_i3.p1 TRINITY_DN13134_c0_g4~~TRINITY_DN13134_c0_g4_i3.p1  ORF type:complete len:485 (-),score=98.82 TRINITY_DN13134_c0_g4_i3:193-1647(-)